MNDNTLNTGANTLNTGDHTLERLVLEMEGVVNSITPEASIGHDIEHVSANDAGGWLLSSIGSFLSTIFCGGCSSSSAINAVDLSASKPLPPRYASVKEPMTTEQRFHELMNEIAEEMEEEDVKRHHTSPVSGASTAFNDRYERPISSEARKLKKESKIVEHIRY